MMLCDYDLDAAVVMPDHAHLILTPEIDEHLQESNAALRK
jgi:REP element-mobilizing transposase RayT